MPNETGNEPIDRKTAERRLRNRYAEQAFRFPLMRSHTSVELYVSANLRQVMREGLLASYEAAS